jgi:hypothetical protein
MLAMFDRETNTYVARCLVNFKEGTYAPVYGPCHYLLEARLKFSGFVEGMLVPLSELESALTVIRSEGLRVKYPKSRRMLKTHITYGEHLETLSKRYERKKEFLDILETEFIKKFNLPDFLISTNPPTQGSYRHFLSIHWDKHIELKELEKTLEAIKEVINRKGKEEPFMKLIKPTVVCIPIKTDWEYKLETKETSKSKLYSDFDGIFVDKVIIATEGWYKKDT